MSNEKSVKICVFNGKEQDYRQWADQILALMLVKDPAYKNLLTGATAVPTASEVAAAKAATPRDTAVIEASEKAAQVFATLLLAMQGSTSKGKIAYAIVTGARNIDHPDGNPKLAWDRLEHKYSPRNADELLNLKKELQECKLTRGDDPDGWITDLEYIMVRMTKIQVAGASTTTETDLMMHILGNLTGDYDTLVPNLQKDLDAGNLTIEQIRTELNAQYKEIGKRKARMM